ncbi:hypothetical protein BKA70DRAFT_1397653 [Coprinopsis sp. MPI-PUGE-AT-0042]|nr:hypothetical protein BKA70DRAFT_1397653 [Coprinopsis sp. MPI-PUGE-AT-0042]
MGAILSKLARWDTAPVEPVIAPEAPPVAEPVAGAPPIQSSGPAFVQNAQGAQNFLAPMHNPTFIQNNRQGDCAQDPEHLRKVLDFLSLVNFRNIQQENHGNWMPDTLKWFLEGSMYQWWLETQGAIVWGTGMPGAGKTILASVAIQDSEDHAPSDICIGYVYCRYTEPMKVRDILAALVRQLLERYPHLLPTVKPLYNKHDLQRTSPTQSELVDVIRAICKSFKIARLFIDGLDEALYDEQFDLLATLKSVPANFFITSRPLLQLNDVLPDVKMFDIAAQNADIELLVSQHIDRNPDLRQMLVADEQRVRVIKKICQSSHGMFLHASLMVEAVSHCISAGHIMEQLDKLPAKLDVLYEATFSRIEAQSEERAALAKRALLWVAYAYRPLTVKELQYAVVRDPKVDWQAPEHLVPESLLVSVCCGLVTVEGNPLRRIVRLVHYTALDALRRILSKPDTSPHCLITELCVERLIDCGIPARQPNDRPYGWTTEPPLVDYACNSWHRHAKESIHCPAEPGARPVASMLRFLSLCTNFSSETDVFTAPIHLVAEYGLPSLLPLIDPQVNKRTQGGRFALSLATCNRDVVMVKLLLELEGVDVNLQDEDGNTALMLAASEGLGDAVKVLLLEPQIDVRMRNKNGETALHCAIFGKHDPWRDLLIRGGASPRLTETALLLIATPGIDVNAADHFGRTPLMLAYDHPPELLNSLAQHPNIDLLKRDKDGQTPLMHACRRGKSSAVEWYLQLPGLDAVDNSGASALAHRAQYAGHDAYEHYLSDFQALFAAGLDVNHRDEKGLTALAHAVQVGSTHAIRALLQLEGVDVNIEDGEGRTPIMVLYDVVLHGAMSFSDLAGFLQHSSLDINAEKSHGTAALAYAVARGVIETAEETLSPNHEGLNKLFPDLDSSLRQGLLYEVHQLDFRMHPKEHPNDRPSETSIDVIVTGRRLPHFFQFRLPYHGTLTKDHRHTLEKCGSLRLPAWISKEHASRVQLLLNHPDINDHGMASLVRYTEDYIFN